MILGVSGGVAADGAPPMSSAERCALSRVMR
jgi:hypothetical protein